MKRFLALFAFALCTSAAAQTTAPGPYYATPSWDQTLPSSTRFVILSNFNSQAVLDRETGLVWARAPVAISVVPNWFEASFVCVRYPQVGLSSAPSTSLPRLGWRLPTVQELGSLLENSFSGAKLPGTFGNPFNVPEDLYWTSTTDLSNTANAWQVILITEGLSGQVANSGPKAQRSAQALCVRSSGHGLDAQ
jgi:hypothetical protein